MRIYLYIKTHIKTGLKYLGKTKNDPYTYMGSGKIWRQHLREHGKEHTTVILRECSSNQELNHWGRYYSDLYDVKNNPEWANLIPETGGGGGHPHTPESIQKLKKPKPPRTQEHCHNLSKALTGTSKPGVSIALTGRKRPAEAVDKLRTSLTTWYANMSDVDKSNKALKTWQARYEKDLDRWIKAWTLLNKGATKADAKRATGFDNSVLTKIANRTHRIFELFPNVFPS